MPSERRSPADSSVRPWPAAEDVIDGALDLTLCRSGSVEGGAFGVGADPGTR